MLQHFRCVAVQGGIDLRVTAAFFEERICRNLKRGECIIRVNFRRTIVRIYCGGEEPFMMCRWARVGERWSRERIANWVRNGLNIELDGIYDEERQRAA